MAKRFPFDLPARTVPSWAGPEDYDSYASFQEDIWNEAGPGTWWEWWLEGLERPEPAMEAVDALESRGCNRVELLLELRQIAADALTTGLTRGQLAQHLKAASDLRDAVEHLQMSGLIADPAVRATSSALIDALSRHIDACHPYKIRLHRTQHALRDDRIRRFQEFVRRSAGGWHHKLVAPLLTAILGRPMTDAQLRMLTKRAIERKR